MLCAAIFPLLFAQAPPGSSYILSIRRVFLSGQESQGDTTTCLTVFPDNTFRLEKTLQFLSDYESADFFVYKGTLTSDQMVQLNMLLNDPELAAAERTDNDPVPGGTAMSEGSRISAHYLRDGGIRNIEYMEAFGVPHQSMDPSNRVNTAKPYYVPSKNPLTGILKWQKDVAEKNKGKSLKGEPAYCSPAGGLARIKKKPVSK